MLMGMATPPRLRWIFTEYPIYYITACSYHRRRILDRPDVHNSFVHFASSATKYGVHVGRYVIMPDHIHLLARFGPESISVSMWMKSVKNAISKTLKTRLFQRRTGKGAFLIMSFGLKSPIPRSGCMFAITPYAPD